MKSTQRSSKKESEFKVLQGLKIFKVKVIKIKDNKEVWSQVIGRAISLDVEIPYQFKSSSSQILKDCLGIV